MKKQQYDSIIGTDCSFAECVASGYMMVRYNRELPLDKQEFEFVQLLPDWCREENKKAGIPNRKLVAHYDASELFEMYNRRKQVYDSFADDLASRKFDYIYNYLALADSMQAYSGIIFE